jgi:phage/plasmid-like protein (TIGR03299 family)
MPAEVETMMYAREVPWHGIGTKVEGLQTSAEALKAAGLDWTVHQAPLTYAPIRTPGDLVQVQYPGRVANYRSSDGAALGIVGDGYQIVQNAEAFEWADSLVDSGEAKYETAGALFGGRRVWLMMELPEGISVPGDDGEIKPYILVTNGHDGGTSLQGSVTMVRTVCANTWTLAIASAIRTFKIRHSGSIDGKLAAARQALGVTFSYSQEFAIAAQALVESPITDKLAEKVLERVFPLPARAQKNPDRVDLEQFGQVLNVYRNSPNLQNIRGTKWGVLQAVGEFLDHETEYRGRVFDAAEVRMDSILYDGPAAAKKQQAFKLLTDKDFARVR